MPTPRTVPLAAFAALTLAAIPAHAHPGHTTPEPPASAFAPAAVTLPDGLPDAATVTVTTRTGTHTLHLVRTSVRGENFRVLETNDDGTFSELQVPPPCTYTGTVGGDPHTFVNAAITPHGLSARVTFGDNTVWEINHPEPDSYQTSHTWRVVPAGEVAADLSSAAAFGLSSEKLFATLALPNTVTVKQAEIGFDIDYPTWSRSDRGGFGRSTAAAVAKMEDFVANKLNNFVLSNALIEHVVGTVVVRRSASQDPYDGMTNAYDILPKMRDVWNGNNGQFPRPSTTHDLASGLIGRSMGGVAGLGYVGTVATGSKYTIGTTTSGSGVGFWYNGLCKHEVAHNWSLGHGGCTTERRPITNPDIFSWSMCGGWHDRMHSDEARKVLSHRDSRSAGALRDIGAYRASNQSPYCPEDNFDVPAGAGPVTLDVLANDYDANNTPFQIEKLQVRDRATSTTELGGTMTISPGTGPGRRDQITYTPPAGAPPGSTDIFWYTVRDSTGRGSFGQVNVTIAADVTPKEINPALYIADTSLDFDGTSNPAGAWQYGAFEDGSTTFRRATARQTDPTEKTGADNRGWQAAGGARLHRYAMAPGENHHAVKRWTSTHSGDIAIHLDVRRADESGGDGQRFSVAHNGTTLWSQALNTTTLQHAAATTRLTVAEGDTVDFVLDRLGNRTNDWVFATARIVRSDHAKPVSAGRPEVHYKLDANSRFPTARRAVAADHSGARNHATLTNINTNTARVATPLEHGVYFDGENDEIRAPQPRRLQNATAFTLSAWVNPSSLGDNRGIVTSMNDDDENRSYFGFLVGASGDGHPAQFRAHRAFVNAPSGSLKTHRWTHLVGVWESGQTHKLYVDGVEVASSGSAPSGGIDTDRWIIGRDREQSNRYFEGGLDDIGMWRRALSAAEITALHAQGREAHTFNGSSDFLQSGRPVYANGATEVTISAWVRPSSLGANDGIVTSYNSDDVNRSYFGLLVVPDDADGFTAQFRAHRQGLDATDPLLLNEWTHIAGVWRDGREQTLYINGRRSGLRTPSARGPVDIESWITARDRLIDNRYFHGDIAELLITPRALDATQVAGLHATGITSYDAANGLFEHAGDVGTPSSPGTFSEASGIVTTSTRGTSVGGTRDNFYFASRSHTGQFELTATLHSINDTGRGAKLGLMARNDHRDDSQMVALYQYGDGRIAVRTRSDYGAAADTPVIVDRPLTFPLHLRLTRDDDDFTASFSTDRETWTPLVTATVDMSATAQIGVLHQAHTSSRRSVASVAGITVESTVSAGPEADLDADGLPDAWERDKFGDLAQTADGDPDGDGVPNAFEHYHGTAPLVPDPPLLTPGFSSDGHATLTFPRSRHAVGRTVTVQATSDFVTWIDLETELEKVGDGASGDILRARDAVPASTAYDRYLRLKLALP